MTTTKNTNRPAPKRLNAYEVKLLRFVECLKEAERLANELLALPARGYSMPCRDLPELALDEWPSIREDLRGLRWVLGVGLCHVGQAVEDHVRVPNR